MFIKQGQFIIFNGYPIKSDYLKKVLPKLFYDVELDFDSPSKQDFKFYILNMQSYCSTV